MAPTPKKKHSPSRSAKREFGKRKILNVSSISRCSSCGKLRFSHTVCANCGYTYTK